jgi:peptide-methionine (S)-S-oxide reductase
MFKRYIDARKLQMPTPEQALPGRSTPMRIHNRHHVKGNPLQPPFPAGMDQIVLGLGCFWGAERKFWQLPGVYTTAVGYSAGHTPNPTYEEVCSGLTGHNEVVLVVFDPAAITLEEILRVFWQAHDPTQGMRQGNDVGTQYRSGVYTFNDAQQCIATNLLQQYQAKLLQSGYESVTTEIQSAGPFYYAEDYHQQYLAKNPGGYCGLGGTGVCFD